MLDGLKDGGAEIVKSVTMLERRIRQVVEIRDRASDAMQMPVDEDTDGAWPALHDLVERKIVDTIADFGHGDPP